MLVINKRVKALILIIMIFITNYVYAERSGFFIGVNYGFGIDDASFFESYEEENEENRIKLILPPKKNNIHNILNIKLGGILTKKLLLGMDIVVIQKEIKESKLLFAGTITSFSYFFNSTLKIFCAIRTVH